MTPITFDHPPERILIIKPSAIGDIVHALPVLNLIRRRWPAARITWVVTPACAGMVERHPLIDEVLYFQRDLFSRFWRSPSTLLAMRLFFRGLRERGFDLVVDLQGLFRSAWVTRQSRAPLRVGFANAREFAPRFYTHRVESSWEDHAVERYLCVADALGCGKGPVEFPFAVDDSDRASVAELLATDQPFAVLLPGANWETKQWPAERFGGLVRPMREQFGLASVVAGGRGDRVLAEKIAGAVDLTGRTNLRQLVALLERAALVIAGDTGPMHIAAALGRPLVTVYGPTDAVMTGPFGRLDSVVQLGIPCRPCFSRRCSHRSCLAWLEETEVLKVAEIQMGQGTPIQVGNPSTAQTPTVS